MTYAQEVAAILDRPLTEYEQRACAYYATRNIPPIIGALNLRRATEQGIGQDFQTNVGAK